MNRISGGRLKPTAIGQFVRFHAQLVIYSAQDLRRSRYGLMYEFLHFFPQLRGNEIVIFPHRTHECQLVGWLEKCCVRCAYHISLRIQLHRSACLNLHTHIMCAKTDPLGVSAHTHGRIRSKYSRKLSTSKSNSQFQIFIINICSTTNRHHLFIHYTLANTCPLDFVLSPSLSSTLQRQNLGHFNRLYQRNHSSKLCNKFTK